MADLELQNSYKCYDSLPSPPNETKRCDLIDPKILRKNSTSQLIRSPSIDSLIPSSEEDNSSDSISDSDSLCELKNIAICDVEINNEQYRKTDIEPIQNNDDTVIEDMGNSFLENSHKSCDYQNCSFKKKTDEINAIEEVPLVNISLKPIRRNSIANQDRDPRMETILEEPIEAKVMTVKEILARFETMRDSNQESVKVD